jgi:hypothetical protein
MVMVPLLHIYIIPNTISCLFLYSYYQSLRKYYMEVTYLNLSDIQCPVHPISILFIDEFCWRAKCWRYIEILSLEIPLSPSLIGWFLPSSPNLTDYTGSVYTASVPFNPCHIHTEQELITLREHLDWQLFVGIRVVHLNTM